MTRKNRDVSTKPSRLRVALMPATMAVVATALILLSACSVSKPDQELAELILTNGRIYTMNPEQPWASSVAVRDGIVMAVGDDETVKAFANTDTEIVDLEGKMAMPGIIDAHVHTVRGALTLLYRCNFSFTATPEEIRETLVRCTQDDPGASWIIGGQWGSSLFQDHDIESPRAFLDEIAPDKIVFLEDDSLHNAWTNSKGLEFAGITKGTDDPVGGVIGRDSSGEPNGLLFETAAKLIKNNLPPMSHDQNVTAAVEFAQIANSYGVTGAKDAGPYESEVAGLQAADQQGRLTVHVAICLRGPDGARSEALDYSAYEAMRDRYKSDHVDTRYFKMFLDGVPTPGRTAAMLAPYMPASGFPAGFSGGEILIAPDVLNNDVVTLDRLGFTVKIHAAGDRSLRHALDAIEAARNANGDSGLRHEIAHAGYVDPKDLERFASLGAIPDLCPQLWAPSPIILAIIDTVGPERGPEYYPIRSMVEKNAMPLAGTDWPAGVPSMNPWPGIEAMITRADPTGATPGTLWPEQAISLEQALTIYTINSATAIRKDDTIGSLIIGKSADIIVLDRNLFEIEASDIGETQVLMTFFEGRLVFNSSNNSHSSLSGSVQSAWEPDR